MKRKIYDIPVGAIVIFLLLGGALLGAVLRQKRSEKPFLQDKGWIPPEDIEFDLPAKYTTREYFAYVTVAAIPYPSHPRNTTDQWHQTASTPDELIGVLERFRGILRVVREREGDREPDHAYWRKYWTKYDRAYRLSYDCSYARTYQTFYARGDQIRVEKYQDQYRAESGYHRLWLAKRMGFTQLPMLVMEHVAP